MTAATKAEIEQWFKNGVTGGESYMVVVCDTFDHEDYPVYFSTADETLKKKVSPGEMQRVMEIYDLKKPISEQIDQYRAMAL